MGRTEPDTKRSTPLAAILAILYTSSTHSSNKMNKLVKLSDQKFRQGAMEAMDIFTHTGYTTCLPPSYSGVRTSEHSDSNDVVRSEQAFADLSSVASSEQSSVASFSSEQSSVASFSFTAS